MRDVAPVPDADSLAELLVRGATVTDAEPVDLLSHALQSASMLAEWAPEDHELQLAGLVHDVGWLLGASAEEHAVIGARWVAPLLGVRVARLVAHHVIAKRYLAAVEPGYELSARSRETLELQGGPLGPEAITDFEADADAASFVMLRRADDVAKEPGAAVADLDRWRPLLETTAEPPR